MSAEDSVPLLYRDYVDTPRVSSWKWATFVLAIACCVGVATIFFLDHQNALLVAELKKNGNTIAPAPQIKGSGRRGGVMSMANMEKWKDVMAPYIQGRKTKPYSWEELSANDLPKSWDWRNVSGLNYLTGNHQQHLPKYCGGCWDFAAIQAISDRINIAMNFTIPPPTLSHQVMLNVQTCGDCEHGGYSNCVFGFAHEHGIPDETCQPFTASTGFDCIPEGKPKDAKYMKSDCWCKNAEADRKTTYAITDFRKWYIGDYGVTPHGDIHAIKSEIYKHGPVVCGLQVSDNMEYEYKGGVWVDDSPWKFEDFDHMLTVSGWGTDEETGLDYWLIRNSWGTYWGEDGWMKLKMGGSNLGIEYECYWGVIDVERSKDIPPTPFSKYYTPPPKPQSV